MGTINLNLYPAFDCAATYEQSSGAWRMLKSQSPTNQCDVQTGLGVRVTSHLDNIDITAQELAQLFIHLPSTYDSLCEYALSEGRGKMAEDMVQSYIKGITEGQVKMMASARPHTSVVDQNFLPFYMQAGGKSFAYNKTEKHWFEAPIPSTMQPAGTIGGWTCFAPASDVKLKMTAKELCESVAEWLNSFASINTPAAQFAYSYAIVNNA